MTTFTDNELHILKLLVRREIDKRRRSEPKLRAKLGADYTGERIEQWEAIFLPLYRKLGGRDEQLRPPS